MSDMARPNRCVLFDWGNTLMRDISEFSGPMRGWPRVEAIPYAVETLTNLRGQWMLALATNAVDSSAADIEAALGRVGLDQVLDKIYCYRGIGHKKPSPQFFGYILNDLRLEPSRVVMVGDDFETDVLGANRAGIRAIWFNERSSELRTGAMYRTILDFRSLPEILREWENDIAD